MTLRIGVLGAARIAPAALIRPARKVPDVEVGADRGPRPGQAAKFADKHGIATVHKSYDDVLADPEIDAVYNPLPNGLHGRWTIAALEAGKHVLCEKPFTANAEEARAVAAVAAGFGPGRDGGVPLPLPPDDRADPGDHRIRRAGRASGTWRRGCASRSCSHATSAGSSASPAAR